jgi:hypothetical protein
MTGLRFSLDSWFVASMIVLAVSGFAARRAVAQDEKSAGIIVSEKVTSNDVGLPIYPGAKPYKKSANDSEVGRASAWFGWFGVKVAAIQMESSDSAQKVADFYRRALEK